MLHITNGDCAADNLRQAGIREEILSWRDMLHEGPVPAVATLEELSEVRARFLTEDGYAAGRDAHGEFLQRDARVRQSFPNEPVTLWFEHDLYDQLQLLQVLDIYAARPHGVTLRQSGHYLGQMEAADLLSTPEQPIDWRLAREAWRTFTAPDPSALVQLSREDLSAFPYLRAALIRWFEEFPCTQNGLSRSEQQILEVIREGVTDRHAIYRAFSLREDPIFLGDAPVWERLDRLSVLVDAELRERLLDNRADYIREMGGIDRWMGGVHLQGVDVWRWDGTSLVRCEE